MTAYLASMTEVLISSPSTWKTCTTTKLSQNISARMTKSAMPGRQRRSGGESSGRSRIRSSGGRKTKGVKGPRAVTSEKWTPGSQILHSKTKRVKFDRTRVVSCKLANREKIVNHLGGYKNGRKTEGRRSRAHGGDGEARTITNHDGRGTGGVRGSDRGEYTGIRSGVEGGARVSDPLEARRRS